MTYRLTERGKAQVVGLLMKHGNMQVQAALINESMLAALFGYVEQQTNSGLYEVGRWPTWQRVYSQRIHNQHNA